MKLVLVGMLVGLTAGGLGWVAETMGQGQAGEKAERDGPCNREILKDWERMGKVVSHASPILEVAYVIGNDPPSLTVTAVGTFGTSGGGDAILIRREKEAANGIWEYDLLAPEGPLDKVRMVTASDTWRGIDAAKVRGIRVHGGGEGVKEIRVEKK